MTWRPNVRLLLNTYWSPQGWRQPAQLPAPAELARAVAAGLMFAKPLSTYYDNLVERAYRFAHETSLAEVGAALLASLGSRRLDLRSALGSYAVARHLPDHQFTKGLDRQCRVYGLYSGVAEVDLNVLSFERIK